MIRNSAAVHPLSDSEVDALGVRELENFCADLMQPITEGDVEDDSTEIILASPLRLVVRTSCSVKLSPSASGNGRCTQCPQCVGVLGFVRQKNSMMNYERNLLE